MKIIAALVRQIHGELNFAKGENDQGTRFSVLFNRRATSGGDAAVQSPSERSGNSAGRADGPNL